MLHHSTSTWRYDGLLLSVGGNGRSYVIILETGPLADTSQTKKYFARMNTKVGFCRVSGIWRYIPSVKASGCALLNIEKIVCFVQVRVPFSAFRPVNPQDPPLDPFLVHTLTIRFEPKKQVSTKRFVICHCNIGQFCWTVGSPVTDETLLQRPGDSSEQGAASDPRNFELKMEFIKALPVSFHFVPHVVMIIVLSPLFFSFR